MEAQTDIFSSSTERTAWNIAARHLAKGQKDPVRMLIEAIEEERERCVALFAAACGQRIEVPMYMVDPDCEW